MTLIKSVEDFKKYVRVIGNISLQTIMAGIPDAQDKYIRDILGDELLDNLDTWYNLSEPPSVAAYENLLPYVQRILARFTLLISSPEIDVTLTDTGIGVVSNQNLAPASSDRVKKYDNSNEKRGWDNIETLLRFLEENQDDYPEWVSSSAYTMAIRNLINSAEQFDKIIEIDKSRLFFKKLRTSLDDADNLHIKPVISPDQFDTILTEIKEDALSEATEKIIIPLRKAEAYYAMIDNLDITKYQGTGVEINKQFLQRDIDNMSIKAESYLGEVRTIMDNNPDDYPEYKASDMYIGLNDDGETDYTIFNNTDEDNTIFVMG